MPASARAERVSATLLFLFSVLVIFGALALPYWTANAPGPGYVPFWLGVMLAGASIGMFARTIAMGSGQTHRDAQPWLPDRATTFRVATVVALTAGAAALSLVAGLVVASGVFMGVTLAYLRRGHPRGNVVAAILTPIVVWLLFVRWLAVPLPAGLFGY
jgi:putative tricarboxylic transport membrane protein